MAIETSAPNIKDNAVLKWKRNGVYAFWDFPFNDRKVTHVSEEFLEGLVLQDGVDDDEGFNYPVESRRKYCDDAKSAGEDIPASVKGNTAGTYTNQSKTAYGTTLLQVEMPFRFWNYDGDNHWDESKTLLVWVNIDDVVNAEDGSDIVLNKVSVANEPNKQPVVPVVPVTPKNQTVVPTTQKGVFASLSGGNTPLIVGGVVLGLGLIGLALYVRAKKKKEALMLQYQQAVA